ncbi:MAG TPA: glycosyl hydrolase family 28-related protein, partial [Pelobium sp.]|nr:glycosyl hydrolase family 28-related protein [Pelobium sp.]
MLTLFSINTAFSQQVSPLWKDFEEAKAKHQIPVLPDFSFAGYHFSERPLPNLLNHKYFDVTQFGAIPNDDKFDDEGIQKAINTAQEYNKPAVVFFPSGKFLFAPDE